MLTRNLSFDKRYVTFIVGNRRLKSVVQPVETLHVYIITVVGSTKYMKTIPGRTELL